MDITFLQFWYEACGFDIGGNPPITTCIFNVGFVYVGHKDIFLIMIIHL